MRNMAQHEQYGAARAIWSRMSNMAQHEKYGAGCNGSDLCSGDALFESATSTEQPDWGYSWPPLALQADTGIVSWNKRTTPYAHILSKLSFVDNTTIRRSIMWVTDNFK
jgi:hypothetical protein